MAVEALEGELPSDADRWVECGECRLRLVEDAGGRIMLGSQVRRDGVWVPAAPPITPLVSGLDLVTEYQAAGTGGVSFGGVAHGATQDGSSVAGSWQGSVTAEMTGWIRIEVELDMAEAPWAKPEVVLWLGTPDTMHERQFATFRQTRLASPTVNAQGLMGNDLPAAFFHDPSQWIDTLVYVPARHLTWTARRFLDYRCDLTLDHIGQRYGIGLTSAGSPTTLPAGRHRFVWYLRQRAATAPPSEWEAQRDLLAAVTPLLGTSQPLTVAWRDVAAGALTDLLTPGDMQIVVEGHLGHPAYVRDTSQVRPEDRRPHRLELMTHLDLIPPLALYLQLHPDSEAERHLELLIDTLPLFHRPDEHWFCNVFPQWRGRWIEDLWYFFENALIKLPWTAAITGRDDLWEMFLDGLAGATTLARKVRYIFPLFADVAAKEPFGSSTNYSVGGMYAFGQLLAHAHTGLAEHLDEAHAAMATLARLPLDRMWHEPQQLGFAAAAAAEISRQRGDTVMRVLAENLLAAQLRMAYWDDRSPRGHSINGMFQACASLLYPAFKENVESLLPWPLLLRAGAGDPALMMRLLDAQRRHNGAFFEATCGQGIGAGRFIPLENLGTVELPGEGRLGKEIYGAGEVFWLYLLLEALGRTDDPAVLACSLDLPDLVALVKFPPSARRFMLFNSSSIDRTIALIVPWLRSGRYTVQAGDRPATEQITTESTLIAPIEIGAGEVLEIEVVPAGMP
ncbi:MAG: hypothetical protein M3Z66_15060 [Chloroflexota bacterium]|nr:hypothetical protein [Chloroflexota bacterium]